MIIEILVAKAAAAAIAKGAGCAVEKLTGSSAAGSAAKTITKIALSPDCGLLDALTGSDETYA